MNPEPESGNERERSAEVIWQDGQFELAVLDRQAMPSEEGTHLQVRPIDATEGDSREAPLRTIAKEAALSIWPSRVLAEFGYTKDGWANQHYDEKFPEGINIYGRNPLSDRAWGERGAQPVMKTAEGFAAPGNEEIRREILPFIERTMRDWSEITKQFELFPEGVSELDPESPEFKERAAKYETYDQVLLWASDKFEIASVNNPHLNGVHLVVNPAETYWSKRGGFDKTWQVEKVRMGHQPKLELPQGFAESAVIAAAAERIITDRLRVDEPDGYRHPELHSSANWAPDLQWSSKGGKFDEQAYREAKTVTERSQMLHRVNPKTAYHMHVYIPERGTVSLPSRPEKQSPDEWEHVESNYQPTPDAGGGTELKPEYLKRVEALRKALYEKSSGLDTTVRETRGPLFG
jgi:hypothetical protein